MSKRKELNSNPQESQRYPKSSHISFLHLDKNAQREKSKSKTNIREKEIKFSYKPKSSYLNNNLENILNNNNINIFESKSSIINLSHQDNNKNIKQEKHKNIALSNKIEKNVIPIFNKKILLENKEKPKKNYVFISKCIKIDKINNDNININKGFAITTSRGKKTLPLKYLSFTRHEYKCFYFIIAHFIYFLKFYFFIFIISQNLFIFFFFVSFKRSAN